jgi:glycosyltransferase involved in cell wall biosynthesis
MTSILSGVYIARLDLTQQHLAGVAAKIRGQIAALESLPARIELIHPANGSILINGQPWKTYGSGKFTKRWTYYFHFYLALASRPGPLDFVYIRDQGCSPLFLWMLRQLRRRHPGIVILIELPSYPFYTGPMSMRERVFSIVDRSTRGLLRYYVDRIVTFSQEKSIFGIETIVTDNGVDVTGVRVLSKPPESDGLRLLGLANLSFWHGYDRVIAGLAEYRSQGGSREVCFDIVGSGSELARLQSLSAELGLNECVRFLGPRNGAELEDVLSQSHVGISSIGMHRLTVDTSNIKSREFCARGLPFVYAYEDRDFNPNLHFVLRLPADESAIDIGEIVRFFDLLRATRPNYALEMHDYAERSLTWHAKMQPVIDVLSSARRNLADRR